jgi:hypothetical protein
MAHAVDVLGVEREAVASREDARPVICPEGQAILGQ